MSGTSANVSVVVNAGGMFAQELGALAGVNVPIVPMAHEYLITKPAGLPLEKVTVHNLLIGGGFGRRLEVDMIDSAVQIAKQVDGPVKVVWTREEDIRHDLYRPVYRDTLSATVADGRVFAWKHRITGSSIIARWLPPAFQKGIDIDAIDSGADIPYDTPNLRVEYVRDEPPGVGANVRLGLFTRIDR